MRTLSLFLQLMRTPFLISALGVTYLYTRMKGFSSSKFLSSCSQAKHPALRYPWQIDYLLECASSTCETIWLVLRSKLGGTKRPYFTNISIVIEITIQILRRLGYCSIKVEVTGMAECKTDFEICVRNFI